MPEPKSPLSKDSLDDLMMNFKDNPDFWRQIFDPSFYEASKEPNKILNFHKYIALLSVELQEKFKTTMQLIEGLQTHMRACLVDETRKQNLSLIRMVMDKVVNSQDPHNYLVISKKIDEREHMLRAAFMQLPSPPEILKNPLLISIRYLELYNKCRQGQDSGYNKFIKAQHEATTSKTPIIFGNIPIASSASKDKTMQVVKSGHFNNEINRAHVLKNLYDTTHSALLTKLQLKFGNDQSKINTEFGKKFPDELKLARVNYRRWRDEFINNKKTSLANIIYEIFMIIEIAQDTSRMGYVGTQKTELDELLNETLILLRKASIVKAARELGNIKPNISISDADKLIAEEQKNENGKKIQHLIVEQSALFLGRISYSQRAKYIEYFEQLDNFHLTSNGWELIPAARFFERDKLSVTYTVNGKLKTSEFGAVKVNEPYKVDYPVLTQLQRDQPIIWPQDKIKSILTPIKLKRTSSKLSTKMSELEINSAELTVSDIHFTYPELDAVTKAALSIAKELNKYVLEYPMSELIGSQDIPKPLIEMLQESISAILTYADILRELEKFLIDNPSRNLDISRINELALFRAQAGSLLFAIKRINIDAAYIKDNGGIDFLTVLEKIKSSVVGCLGTEQIKSFAQEPMEELLTTLDIIIGSVKKIIAQSAAPRRP